MWFVIYRNLYEYLCFVIVFLAFVLILFRLHSSGVEQIDREMGSAKENKKLIF